MWRSDLGNEWRWRAFCSVKTYFLHFSLLQLGFAARLAVGLVVLVVPRLLSAPLSVRMRCLFTLLLQVLASLALLSLRDTHTQHTRQPRTPNNKQTQQHSTYTSFASRYTPTA